MTYKHLNTLNLIDDFSSDDILSTLFESGIINEDGVLLAMKKKQNEVLLSHHKHKIWEGDDGRWRTYLPDEDKPKGRRLISRNSRDALIDMLADFYKEAEEAQSRHNMTLVNLFPEWQVYKSKYVTDATIKRDKTTWKSLYEGDSITTKPICELTKDEIEGWMLKKIRENNMNSHQYNNFSSIIRQLMSYAEKIEIIDVNPFDKVRIAKDRELKPESKGASETEVFSAQERDNLIEYALRQYDKKRDRVQMFTPLAIAFLLYAGMRRGEVTALKFEDIDGRQVILTDSYSHDMKKMKGRLKDGNGWRRMVLVPGALEIIETVRQERERLGMPTDGYVFCVDEKFESFYSALGKMINNYCKELGIRQRSLHKTRKTVASMMHADGIDDLIIQKELGHKDVQTTQKCYCYDLTKDEERYEIIAQSLA